MDEPVTRLEDPRVLVLAGSTGTGKSDLAAQLAEAVGGAVVSADSRQVFRGMEIGTAQPDAALRARAPHYLVGFLSPEAEYDAATFARDARRVLEGLRARRVPAVVCGGTGLYLRALLEGVPGSGAATGTSWGRKRARRRVLAGRWRAEGGGVLHAELARVDPGLAAEIHPADRQRVIRGLEFHAEHGAPLSEARRRRGAASGTGPLRFRLELPVVELDRRLDARMAAMARNGWLDEARRLLDRFGSTPPRALEAVGYAELFSVLRGEQPLDEALAALRLRTRRYAKRQRTWFRRQDGYVAVEAGPDAFDVLLTAWRQRLA